MKWRTVSISLFGVTLLALLCLLLMKLLPGQGNQVFSKAFIGNDIQLGYYDLLARQREIYDTHFTTQGNTVIMTMTSPNDNRFMAKISLEPLRQDQNGAQYQCRHIYYADSGQARMIKNILGYAEQNGVRFNTLNFGNDHLVITPSGQIFSYQ